MPKAPKIYSWLNDHLDEAERTKITVVKDWPAWNRKHDEDDDTRSWFARGAALTALRFIMEHVPTYTHTDFLVVNRDSKHGKVPTHEVWTLRDFKKGDLMLVPVSTSSWTNSGRGKAAHPS